jgi:hypothetical protein
LAAYFQSPRHFTSGGKKELHFQEGRRRRRRRRGRRRRSIIAVFNASAQMTALLENLLLNAGCCRGQNKKKPFLHGHQLCKMRPTYLSSPLSLSLSLSCPLFLPNAVGRR